MTASGLSGRCALVTGGSSGIGRGIVLALLGSGAHVAFTHRGGRSRNEVDELVASYRRETGNEHVYPVALDVTEVPAIPGAIERAATALGGLDILVNNAGTNVQQLALDVDEATWDSVVDTNLKGTFFVSQAAARIMGAGRRAEATSNIVNIASQMGFVGYYRRAAYCASKAGVVNLTRALAVEWADLRIRVNAVAPGFIHTPLADRMFEDEAFEREIRSRSPLGEIGEPEDVAAAVLFLAGPGARLVTGHTLRVDGGWTAW